MTRSKRYDLTDKGEATRARYNAKRKSDPILKRKASEASRRYREKMKASLRGEDNGN